LPGLYTAARPFYIFNQGTCCYFHNYCSRICESAPSDTCDGEEVLRKRATAEIHREDSSFRTLTELLPSRVHKCLDENPEDSAKMPSPSTSQASSESAEANNQQSSIKVEEDGNSPSQYATFAPCTSRSAEFVALLNAAFADSMQKRNEEALKKLQEAIRMKEGFDTGLDDNGRADVFSKKGLTALYSTLADDVSLVDNAFACQMNKTIDLTEKATICEMWLNALREILPAESTRWISHYQFSVYYCFHMEAVCITPDVENSLWRQLLWCGNLRDGKPLLLKMGLRGQDLLVCCGKIRETVEEIIASKLDILLSLSFIGAQYCDVSDEESANFIENELHAIEDLVKGNYPAETAALMVQKVYRIGNNLEKQRSALVERNAIAEHALGTVS
uniref:Low phytic acid3 n=1 Tax=Ascaris lumbricoides TaxID=6252 RepID=A0A0M3I0V2_ASCLU